MRSLPAVTCSKSLSVSDVFEESFRQVIREGISAGVFRPVDVPIFVNRGRITGWGSGTSRVVG